ncbi:MAG: class I SAM-dependent methyltransferase [Deltaproteobacteria bacterium]|nr:class I SAM-dependent methyltransferase [Deltaproteobacteria bacterium]
MVKEIAVQNQYQKFPYPPIPFFGLPLKSQGKSLQWERGFELLQKNLDQEIDPSHRNKRILVAGCGTLEALVVAQQHPYAKEVTAMDFSAPSLNILKKRLGYHKFKRILTLGLSRPALPPMRLIQQDLRSEINGPFDYITATCVLHHDPEPASLLKHLADQLNPGGLMRVATYPSQSRLWMRLTTAFFAQHNLTPDTPNLYKEALDCIMCLRKTHPIRHTFLLHKSAKSKSELIDAFFHACECPLAPLEWKVAGEDAGLTWVGEDHDIQSQSGFLSELLPQTAKLKPWTRLQIVDDLLELCANPVIWFWKNPCADSAKNELRLIQPYLHKVTGHDFDMDILTRRQLGFGLKRASLLLEKAGVTLAEAKKALEDSVGPRTIAKKDGTEEVLNGLSLVDYHWEGLLNDARI